MANSSAWSGVRISRWSLEEVAEDVEAEREGVEEEELVFLVRLNGHVVPLVSDIPDTIFHYCLLFFDLVYIVFL